MTIPDLPFDADMLPEREGVYLVGGTTRDMLLGLSPTDYDIAVARNPEKFAQLTAVRNNGRIIRMGRPGKISFRVVANGVVMDITGLNGPTIDHDLGNRDVTINAMAIDLASGKLLDPLGGRRDLSEKRIRMVSDKSFSKDSIRLLRVFRLAAVLEFSIHTQTISAILRDADLIRFSAGERIRSELHKLFSNRNSFPYLVEMAETGLLVSIFPELGPFRHSRKDGKSQLLKQSLALYEQMENLLCNPPPAFPFTETEAALPTNPDQPAWLKCATLFHPIGESLEPAPPPGHLRPGHPEKTARAMAEKICKRLRSSRKEQRLITDILLFRKVPGHLYECYRRKALDSRATTRFFMLGSVHTPHLLLYALAEAKSELHGKARNTNSFSDFILQLLRTYYETFLARKKLPPLITGRDLISVFGLSPSADFRKILNRLEEERLSGNLTDRESALAMARGMIGKF